MPIITQTSNICSTNKHITGLKAESLTMLESFGLQVPSWIVIPSAEFLDYIPEHILQQSASEVTEFIKNIRLDSSLIGQISNWIHTNGFESSHFAVRASICIDGSLDHTFAGQLKTCLYVPQNELAEAILNVWASPFTPTACAYRAQWGLPQESIRIAVIIQQMIDPDVSGISMSFNPHNGSRSSVTISSMFGFSQGIGSNRVDADHYSIDFSGQKPFRVSKIFEKRYKTVYNQVAGSGITLAPLNYSMRSRSSLTPDQVLNLAEVTRIISSRSGRPQMLDWAISQNKLYILQSRSIHALHNIPDTTDTRRMWSILDLSFFYSGSVSPLSFSIIRKHTERALYSFSQKSVTMPGVAVQPEQCDVLGTINGKLFVNQKKYQDILRLLPFAHFNLHGNNKNSTNTKKSLISSHVIFCKDIYSLMTEVTRGNIKNSEKYTDQFDSILTTSKSYQFIDHIHLLDSDLAALWRSLVMCEHYITVIVNYLHEIVLGNGTNPTVVTSYIHTIVSRNNSLAQVKGLCEITKAINERPAIREMFLDCTIDEICKHLGLLNAVAPECDEVSVLVIRKMILDHLNIHGNAGWRNLRFESAVHEQNVFATLGIIRSYLSAGLTESKRSSEHSATSENIVKLRRLSLSRRIHIKLLSGLLKRLMSQRNEYFYQQTTSFKAAWKLFTTIGNRFHSEEIIENAEDIQFLTKEEIVDFIEGQSVTTNLKQLIALRKNEQSVHKQRSNTINIETFGMVYNGNHHENQNSVDLQTLSLFQGIGNGAGSCCGKVRIVEIPDIIEDFEDTILVVGNCDPGWISVIPLVKGLIIGQGSVYSELAIACSMSGIPCVLSVSGCMKDLRDGDQVELDSESGKVTILCDCISL